MRLVLACVVMAVAAGCGGGGNVVATPACTPAGAGWEICDLGTLGGDGSAAVAVNDRGQVAGTADTTPPPRPGAGTGVISHAFLWEDGSMRDLGSLGGTQTQVSAINGSGQVVGSSETAGGEQHGFLWDNGMHDLAPIAFAYAINDRGEVAGTSWDPLHDLLWADGRTTDIGAVACDLPLVINEPGEILGGCGASAFVWEAGRTTTFGPLPGGRNVYPYAMNDRGQVVGESSVASGHWHAFLWQDGRMVDLTPATERDTRAAAINDAGQVAGFGPNGAFLWQDGRLRDLGVEADSEAGGVDTPFPALALNSRGHLVGTTQGGQAFFWADGRVRILRGLAQGDQDESAAFSVNDHDMVVGTSLTELGNTHAVVWRRVPA